MDLIRWDEFLGSLDERRLDIYTDDIASELLALDSGRRTPEKRIIDPASFFGISLDEVIGDLRDEVPMIEVGSLTSLGSFTDHPEAIHIEIYFFPFFEIEVVVCRHRDIELSLLILWISCTFPTQKIPHFHEGIF
jgi:hypothetical protein